MPGFRCIAQKGEDAAECNKFAKYYRALCPGEWVCTIFLIHSPSCNPQLIIFLSPHKICTDIVENALLSLICVSSPNFL